MNTKPNKFEVLKVQTGKCIHIPERAILQNSKAPSKSSNAVKTYEAALFKRKQCQAAPKIKNRTLPRLFSCCLGKGQSKGVNTQPASSITASSILLGKRIKIHNGQKTLLKRNRTKKETVGCQPNRRSNQSLEIVSELLTKSTSKENFSSIKRSTHFRRNRKEPSVVQVIHTLARKFKNKIPPRANKNNAVVIRVPKAYAPATSRANILPPRRISKTDKSERPLVIRDNSSNSYRSNAKKGITHSIKICGPGEISVKIESSSNSM